MSQVITIADARGNPREADQAFRLGARLHVPFPDAMAVWRELDSVDLTHNLKADLLGLGEQLSTPGASATVTAALLARLRPALSGSPKPTKPTKPAKPAEPAEPVDPEAPRAAKAPGVVATEAGEAPEVPVHAGPEMIAIGGAIAAAVGIVVLGFAVGVAAGWVAAGDGKGSLEVDNGGDGSVTVTHNNGNGDNPPKP